MKIKTVRKTYTREFKIAAVEAMGRDGISHTQLAKELGIPVNNLYNWRAQLRNDPENAFPGKGHQTPENDELSRLRREVEQLRQERDFLRKAAAYFAQE